MNRKLSNPELFILRALVGNAAQLWDLLEAMRERNFIRRSHAGEVVFRRMVRRLTDAGFLCISNIHGNALSFLDGKAWTLQGGMEKIAAQSK